MVIVSNQHPFWENHEIIHTELLPHLDDQSILALRKTSSLLKGIFEIPFRELRNQAFIAKHGSLAESEKTLSFDELMKRAKAEYRLWENHWGQPSNPWPVFNSEGVPQFVDYKRYYFENITSWTALLRAKYRLYRCEDLQGLQRNLELSDSISSELSQTPLSTVHPLQDLRNRCRRLETLTAERTHLQTFQGPLAESQNSYNDFLKNLSVIERILFFIVSLFHSLFQRAYHPIRALPNLPISFDKMIQTQVVLGIAEITFHGESIPLEIRAKLGSNDTLTFSKKTIFTIYNQNTHTELGSFGMEQVWTREHDSETSPKAMVPHSSLKTRKLYIQHLEDRLGQDTQNGDRPITRLMTQIAVEVLQRELESLLEIGPHNNKHFDVYLAGGFSFCNPHATRIAVELWNTNRVRERIKETREAAPRKLFSSTVFTSKAPVYLEKSSTDVPTAWNSSTRFVTTVEHGKEPALADFVINEIPIPWEEQIQTHRLLSATQGPILPKFFYMNPRRSETPFTSA